MNAGCHGTAFEGASLWHPVLSTLGQGEALMSSCQHCYLYHQEPPTTRKPFEEEEDPAHYVTNLKTQAKEKIKYKIEGLSRGESQTWNKHAVNECQKSVKFHNYTCSGSPTQTALKTNISKTARE